MSIKKVRKVLSKVVSELIPYRPWRTAVHHFIADGSITQWLARRRLGRERMAEIRAGAVYGKNAIDLGIVAIMKNEGRFLAEWIEYHRLVGVQKFYLYDNDSTDDTRRVLAPYVQAGIVEYTWWPGEKRQLPAYEDCVAKHARDVRWLAPIDLDEFIVPVAHAGITDFLKTMPDTVSQVIIKWTLYGSNGHEKRPDGLVIENYTMRDKPSKTRLYKAIVRPYLTVGMGCHSHGALGRTRHISRRVMRVNHYHCKSWQDYQARAPRGDAINGSAHGMGRYTREFFDKHDFNDVYDPIMLKYVPRIKKVLRK